MIFAATVTQLEDQLYRTQSANLMLFAALVALALAWYVWPTPCQHGEMRRCDACIREQRQAEERELVSRHEAYHKTTVQPGCIHCERRKRQDA